MRIASIAALIVAAMLSLVIANTGILRSFGVPLSARSDPSTRLRGWRDTVAAVEDLRGDLPVVAHHYGLASELAFYGAIDAGVPRTERPKNQFWFWAGRSEGRFLFVSDRIAAPQDPGMQCVPAGERRIEGEGGTLRTIRAYSCVMTIPVSP